MKKLLLSAAGLLILCVTAVLFSCAMENSALNNPVKGGVGADIRLLSYTSPLVSAVPVAVTACCYNSTGNNGPDHLIDGNTGNYWDWAWNGGDAGYGGGDAGTGHNTSGRFPGNTPTHWVTVDLGEATIGLYRLGLVRRNSSSPKDVAVYAGNTDLGDAINSANLVTGPANAFSNTSGWQYLNFSPVTARYVHLRIYQDLSSSLPALEGAFSEITVESNAFTAVDAHAPDEVYLAGQALVPTLNAPGFAPKIQALLDELDGYKTVNYGGYTTTQKVAAQKTIDAAAGILVALINTVKLLDAASVAGTLLLPTLTSSPGMHAKIQGLLADLDGYRKGDYSTMTAAQWTVIQKDMDE